MKVCFAVVFSALIFCQANADIIENLLKIVELAVHPVNNVREKKETKQEDKGFWEPLLSSLEGLVKDVENGSPRDKRERSLDTKLDTSLEEDDYHNRNYFPRHRSETLTKKSNIGPPPRHRSELGPPPRYPQFAPESRSLPSEKPVPDFSPKESLIEDSDNRRGYQGFVENANESGPYSGYPPRAEPENVRPNHAEDKYYSQPQPQQEVSFDMPPIDNLMDHLGFYFGSILKYLALFFRNFSHIHKWEQAKLMWNGVKHFFRSIKNQLQTLKNNRQP